MKHYLTIEDLEGMYGVKNMKFKIKEEEEESIELCLESYGDIINLIGKDSNGNTDTIMVFKDGRFYRCQDITLIEIEKDDKGRIKER